MTFVKYCGNNQRLTVNIKGDRTLSTVLVQLMDHFKEPDKPIVIRGSMSAMFELTLGDYHPE